MMTYGPGTPLVALTSQDAKLWPTERGYHRIADPITEGALYVCRSVEPFRPGMSCSYCAGRADGITLHGKQGVFCSTIFRPLNDGQVEETRADQRKAPVRVGEYLVMGPPPFLKNCRCVIIPLEPPA